MKEKTFGKESKTPFPNFKSINNVENKESLLTDQVEKINVKRMDFHMKLSFRENERNDLSDSGILRKEKKMEMKAKLILP